MKYVKFAKYGVIALIVIVLIYLAWPTDNAEAYRVTSRAPGQNFWPMVIVTSIAICSIAGLVFGFIYNRGRQYERDNVLIVADMLLKALQIDKQTEARLGTAFGKFGRDMAKFGISFQKELEEKAGLPMFGDSPEYSNINIAGLDDDARRQRLSIDEESE